MNLENLPLSLVLLLFAGASLVVLLAGIRLTRLADRFADQSGMGEAVTGAVFLGALTSLSGSVTSVTAALEGQPELALSNAIGGIAAQTMFLVIADLAYRRANLEHAAASLPNMISGLSLILMLTALVAAAQLPEIAVAAIHPVSPLLLVAYAIGVRAAASARETPMWGPHRTRHTLEDVAEEPEQKEGAFRLLLIILLLGAIVGFAGYGIAQSGIEIAGRTGMRQSVMGALFTSIATSTPELVTTVAAVRRGALTLAVAGILGGNAFDVLFAAFSDVAYRDGSIYHTMGPDQVYLILLTSLMTGVLLMGLMNRERHGPANIGRESVTLGALYILGMGLFVIAFGTAA